MDSHEQQPNRQIYTGHVKATTNYEATLLPASLYTHAERQLREFYRADCEDVGGIRELVHPDLRSKSRHGVKGRGASELSFVAGWDRIG